MRRLLLNAFLLSCIVTTAQNFTHSLSLFSGINGMQALPVSTELKNLSNTNFSDLRLYDKDSTEVPYFIVNENFVYSSTSFKEYQVIEKSVGKRDYTSFIVVNEEKKPMQNIIICTAGSDAVKRCDIIGSDDNKQWFSISDHIYIHHLFEENSVDVYRSIYFPLVNYKYIKVMIDDWHAYPYNIKKVGYFEGAINAGKLNLVQPLSFDYSTNKEKKTSHATIKFSHSTIIDNVTFKIKSPNFYKRRAQFYITRTRTLANKKTEEYRDVLFEFELNSETNNSFNLSGFREKEFEMEIINEDNPPLVIDSTAFQQLQTYLVADFKAGGIYKLYTGNKKLDPPVYDIENFRHKITQYLPTLDVTPLKALPPPAPKAPPVTEEKPVWEQPWFMWACIAVASFMLFLFSLKVLKDIKGRQE